MVAFLWKCFIPLYIVLAHKGLLNFSPLLMIPENFVDDRFKSVHQWTPIYFRPNALSFDLYAYVSEKETSFESESELVWTLKNLTYSQLNSTHREMQTTISISEVSTIIVLQLLGFICQELQPCKLRATYYVTPECAEQRQSLPAPLHGQERPPAHFVQRQPNEWRSLLPHFSFREQNCSPIEETNPLQEKEIRWRSIQR